MILADENIDGRIISSLRSADLNVVSVLEDYKSIPDSEIIKISKRANLIILTEDKDFGEWVFAHNVKGLSVIFIRYHFRDIEIMIDTLVSYISSHSQELFGYFTTITKSKIRRRQI